MSNIVHISPSVLAGSPGMLSGAQQDLAGHDSIHFRFGDYGADRDVISPRSHTVTGTRDDQDMFVTAVERAQIVHVHNFAPLLAREWLAQIPGIGTRTFIYQVHSPTGERPIFADLSDDHGLPWAAKIAMAQAHPRMYPDFLMAPNCLYRPTLQPIAPSRLSDDEPLPVLHSPSTDDRHRWSAKTDRDTDTALRGLEAEGWARVTVVRRQPPEQLLRLRRLYPVQLDEVVTGGFHLVSYEAMATGAVAINAADSESLAVMQAALGADEPPPFIRTTGAGLFDTVSALAHDRDRLHELRLRSFNYFWRYLAPEKVVAYYDEIYRRAS